MARVNWSRWVADCPSPFCTSALQLQREQPWFQCWECGEVGEIEWPSFGDEIERVLLMRPDPFTHNWEPGETLHDLYTQNLAHGIWPTSAESIIAAGGGPLFAVTDDRIVVDKAALPSGPRRQIGG
jgi:hypothetical protein